MKLSNIRDAAEYLGVSPSFLYKQTAAGAIRHFKLGSAIRFSETQLSEWLDDHVIHPVGEQRRAARRAS